MAAPAGKTYRVNAVAREGFLDRRRIGEAWPRGAGNFREVFVLEADEDPPGRRLEDGTTFAIGQKSFTALKKDPEIFTNSEDTGSESDEVAKWRGRATDAARRLVQVEALLKNDPEKAALQEQIADLEDQILTHLTDKDALKKHVGELEQLLAEATKPAKTPTPASGTGGAAA